MDVKIITRDSEIISNGSVIIQDQDYVEFQISNLRFRIEFIVEKNAKGELSERRLTLNVVADDIGNRMDIQFINYEKSTNETPIQTLSLANLENRPLLLDFAVSYLNKGENGKGCNIFHYTWYYKNA